jgi:gluconolactonase
MRLAHITTVVALVSGLLVTCLTAAEPRREAATGQSEGPAWDRKGSLYFTSKGQILRRDPTGKIHLFREDAQANGLMFDHQGRLIACESGRRRVTRTEPNGEVTILADNYESKRFNSPNDLAIDKQGRIYFSDPRYGNRNDMEVPESVYRIDGAGKVTRILSAPSIDRPNGLLVSPDDKYLYVADNNNNTSGGSRKLLRFDLKTDGSIDTESRKELFDWRTGRGPDGLDVDRAGNLYVAGGRNNRNDNEPATDFPGGIYVLSPEGKKLDFIPIPDDEVTNCAVAGPNAETLFITAGEHLWSVPLTPNRK